ncbi:alpha/beta hydrolase [Sphingobacteriales bacterium UPWRP_1]|nr:hypothetical protein B6N25_03455 [Sphingobacteriales bacterium TSM_CSS]PSJ76510.1 alpha/beta hydrolase [Sphingobacteriales bacterium UPWRP_1]
MASIQSYLVRGTLHLAKGVVIARKQHSEIGNLRRSFERATRNLPMPGNVEVLHFKMNHIGAAWFTPSLGNSQRAMLFLHGGGYATGSINTAKSLVAKLAVETGINILAINYRLAPEQPFPAALEDAVAAYEYLLQQDYLPQNISIAGSSAGGGLVLATLLYLKDNNLPMPAAAVCLSPWTDLTGSGSSLKTNVVKDPVLIARFMPQWAARYATNQPLSHPYISPLFGNLQGLPPLLLQVGTHEILLDDSVRFAETARNHGVDVTLEVWQNMMHGWQLHWVYMPEAGHAIANITRFLHRHLQEPDLS